MASVKRLTTSAPATTQTLDTDHHALVGGHEGKHGNT